VSIHQAVQTFFRTINHFTVRLIYNKNPNLQQQYDGTNRIAISLKKGEKFSFALLGSVCTGRDFIDPYNESDREVIYGAKEGLNRLMDGHRKLWNELWKGIL